MDILAAAKEKMIGFKELKAEVDAKMSRVQEMLDVIR